MPQLEEFVRARTIHHDASYLSSDPAYTHAHVTALGPFAPTLTEDVARRVAAVAAATEPFTFVLKPVVGRFADGILHLRPEPDEAFRDLTARLVAEFPEFPPYGGTFEPVPHLTLDLATAEVTAESTLALIGAALPATCRAERVDLAWYEPHRTRAIASWTLGCGPCDVSVR
ncbi:2'-5' RNA ligase family protein [Nocardioides caricicola]|uniref:2'-5' RNA ligase family protein n=1 Tax=Nocardioides caricicola TaxID=634770 RepID=A0ABW0MYH4_9ACTN